jgi:aminocarboxymuconate-semialdehyde decarboxylase
VAQESGLEKPPLDYFKMLYADTALGEDAPTKCGHAFFGTANSLFATDAPFDAEQGYRLIANTLRAVDALEISKDEKDAIFSGNAKRLLRL